MAGYGENESVVEGGRSASGERGELVCGCEEEGGADAVVGVDLGWEDRHGLEKLSAILRRAEVHR